MKLYLSICALAATSLPLVAGTVTNFTMVSIADQVVTKQIPLRSGESLGVVQYFGEVSLPFSFTVDGVRVDNIRALSPGVTTDSFRRVLGPGVVEIILPHNGAPSGRFQCIIALDIDGAPALGGVPVVNIPSNAVVIPADAGGPVQVLLESSMDLVTWNAALPGSYGTTTSNRFFRVRTLRQ